MGTMIQKTVTEDEPELKIGKQNVGLRPGFRNVELRMRLLREEMQELEEAVEAKDFAKAIDALGDIDYIASGTGTEWGVDLDPIFDLIHEANMNKFAEGGHQREDGKWMKPPDWVEPDIQGEIDRQTQLWDQLNKWNLTALKSL